jgi:hypothetical protein
LLRKQRDHKEDDVFTKNNGQFGRFILTALLALGLTGVAVAQQPASSTPPVNRAELDNFTKFLLNHPQALQVLKQNPSLFNDSSFQAQHPALQNFLREYPGVAEQLRANPAQFLHDERLFASHGLEINRAQAAEADRFLDSHPEIARELRRNPSLIDNNEWVARHPELKEFLKTHPQIRKEWRETPNAFERREAQYEKRVEKRGPRPGPKPPVHQ